MAQVVLPHDYLTFRMTGAFTTDRGDASGTGYWSPASGAYSDEVLALIDADRDWSRRAAARARPARVGGGVERRAVVGPGTGDNMAAAMGVGLRTGDAVISAGTSGTAFAVVRVAGGRSRPARSPDSPMRRAGSCRSCAP